MERKPVVCIGSMSKVHLAAVQKAFEWMIVDFHQFVLFPEYESIPVGKQETMQRARYRALTAQRMHSQALFYVGIENGMVQQRGIWYDVAAITVINEHKEYELWSAYLPITPSKITEVNNTLVWHPTENDKKQQIQFIQQAIRAWLVSDERRYRRKSRKCRNIAIGIAIAAIVIGVVPTLLSWIKPFPLLFHVLGYWLR